IFQLGINIYSVQSQVTEFNARLNVVEGHNWLTHGCLHTPAHHCQHSVQPTKALCNIAIAFFQFV
ncbi:unnamed protein product, partial [Ceratitis capitata]